MWPEVSSVVPYYPDGGLGTVNKNVVHGFCGMARSARLSLFIAWDVGPELAYLLGSVHCFQEELLDFYSYVLVVDSEP